MSKRLICLLLSLVLLLGMLAGCAEKDDTTAAGDIADKASEDTKTLAMYLMSEQPVSAETATKIESAVNAITEAKFKARMKLYFYTEEEYYTKLEEAFAARDAAKANGTLASNSNASENEEAQTMVNEYGVVTLSYPTIASYQVDIFYLGGQDMYNKYKDDGRLTRLDEELNSSSKELKKYIPATFLDNVKSLNSGTYALPTSKPIGEYTYLLLNKEALATTHRNANDFSAYTSLTSEACREFLDVITDSTMALGDTYYPIYTNLDQKELLLTNLQYWGVDEAGELSDAFSVLGGYYNNSQDYLDPNTYAKIGNLFENEQFISDLTTLKEYEVNGYFGTGENTDKKFAVGYVRGGAELAELYADEYEMIPVSCPRLDEDDIYSDMFAVCSYTSSTSRSMKILTHLNTDETFRNLLLYGIEGEHYQLNSSEQKNALGENYKTVKMLSTDYVMDLHKTGNTLITYPLEGELETIREYGVDQNLDAKTELALGFTPDYDGFEVDSEALQAVRTLSAEIWAEYLACDTMEAFNTFLASAKTRVAESEAVQKHLDYDHGLDGKGAEKACDGTCGSLQCSYTAWLKDKKITK